MTWTPNGPIFYVPPQLAGLGALPAPSSDPRLVGITPQIPIRRWRLQGDNDAVTAQTLEIMGRLAVESSRDPGMIDHARSLVADIQRKDYEAEAARVFDHVRDTVRYVHDVAGQETLIDPRWLLWVFGSEDCFTHGTKVLRREGHALVPIETLRIGDEIWGRDRWSRVTNAWEKGHLATWMVRLNNGSTMRLTPDHKVWVARCPHDGQTRKRPCHCRMDAREVVVMRVEELRPGMCVVQPDEVGYGTGEIDPDRAYVEGLYTADGWCASDASFCISGRDGFPKEEQKREVEAICASLGISTSWHEKHVRVFDAEWTRRMAAMGKHATQKHALSINYTKEVADRLLDGLLSDAGIDTNGKGMTFSTTSYELMLQVRVLLKQRGIRCSTRHVIDHGGLGKHAIWRLGVRGWTGNGSVRGKTNGPDRRKPTHDSGKLLRVREVIADGLVLPCVDIQTDDKNVWLPEADWTVHNCDGHATLVAALGMALGMGAAFRTVATTCETDPRTGKRTCPWAHVYTMLGIPRGGAVEWVAADTAEGSSLGWEPPKNKISRERTWIVAQP